LKHARKHAGALQVENCRLVKKMVLDFGDGKNAGADGENAAATRRQTTANNNDSGGGGGGGGKRGMLTEDEDILKARKAMNIELTLASKNIARNLRKKAKKNQPRRKSSINKFVLQKKVSFHKTNFVLPENSLAKHLTKLTDAADLFSANPPAGASTAGGGGGKSGVSSSRGGDSSADDRHDDIEVNFEKLKKKFDQTEKNIVLKKARGRTASSIQLKSS
jgi:hypothetical protein